jgi:hypothetical protein
LHVTPSAPSDCHRLRAPHNQFVHPRRLCLNSYLWHCSSRVSPLALQISFGTRIIGTGLSQNSVFSSTSHRTPLHYYYYYYYCYDYYHRKIFWVTGVPMHLRYRFLPSSYRLYTRMNMLQLSRTCKFTRYYYSSS